MKPTFSIIHPSRSRSQKSRDTLNRWKQRAAEKDYEIITSLDVDDPDLNNYDQSDIMVVSPNNSAVEAINIAATHANGNILMVVSDDTDCPDNWDLILKIAIGNSTDFLLNLGDGIQRWMCTFPVMDREYYNRFNYIYPPMYRHMFTDTHLTHVADILKRIIWRKDIIFPHHHYSVTKEPKDYVTLKADATVQSGYATYIKQCRNKFGLGEVNIFDLHESAIPSGHLAWLQQHLQ